MPADAVLPMLSGIAAAPAPATSSSDRNEVRPSGQFQQRLLNASAANPPRTDVHGFARRPEAPGLAGNAVPPGRIDPALATSVGRDAERPPEAKGSGALSAELLVVEIVGSEQQAERGSVSFDSRIAAVPTLAPVAAGQPIGAGDAGDAANLPTAAAALEATKIAGTSTSPATATPWALIPPSPHDHGQGESATQRTITSQNDPASLPYGVPQGVSPAVSPRIEPGDVAPPPGLGRALAGAAVFRSGADSIFRDSLAVNGVVAALNPAPEIASATAEGFQSAQTDAIPNPRSDRKSIGAASPDALDEGASSPVAEPFRAIAPENELEAEVTGAGVATSHVAASQSNKAPSAENALTQETALAPLVRGSSRDREEHRAESTDAPAASATSSPPPSASGATSNSGKSVETSEPADVASRNGRAQGSRRAANDAPLTATRIESAEASHSNPPAARAEAQAGTVLPSASRQTADSAKREEILAGVRDQAGMSVPLEPAGAISTPSAGLPHEERLAPAVTSTLDAVEVMQSQVPRDLPAAASIRPLAVGSDSDGGGRSPASVATLPASSDIVNQAAAALRGSEGLDRPIRIRLSPHELGALRVEVSRQDGGILARFEVTTTAAQSALNDQLSTLRESLARAGLPVERIEVRIVEPRQDERPGEERRDSAEGRQSQSEGRRQDERQHRRQAARHIPESDGSPDRAVPVEETPSRKGRTARVAGADLLDIQV